mgnify:FL=1
MSQITDFKFPSSAGTCQIHARQWLPDTTPYTGIVQLVHGIAEHIARYDAFARFLNAQGYIVVGNDHLGHGSSMARPENPGYFADREGWTHVSNDVRTLQILTMRHFPNLPYFLFGHSMGSFLVRTCLIRFPGTVQGAVLCGTGWLPGAKLTAAQAAAQLECLRGGKRKPSPLLAHLSFDPYNQQFAPNRTQYDWLSANSENVDAYLADPMCGFTPTAGLFRDLASGLHLIQNPKQLSHMKKDTPVLFIAGAQDPVGSNGEGVRQTYLHFKKAGMKHLDIRIYPGMRHEILNETGCETVYQDVCAWLARKRRAAV